MIPISYRLKGLKTYYYFVHFYYCIYGICYYSQLYDDMTVLSFILTTCTYLTLELKCIRLSVC